MTPRNLRIDGVWHESEDGTNWTAIREKSCKSVGTGAPVDASQGVSVAPTKPDRQQIINEYENAFQMRSWDTVEAMQGEHPFLFHTTQAEYNEAMRVWDEGS